MKFQEWLKHEYERLNCEVSLFKPHYCVFVDNVQLHWTSDNTDEELSDQTYNELTLWKAGPFKIVKVQDKALTIYEHWLLLAASTEVLFHAPGSTRTSCQLPSDSTDEPRKSNQENHNKIILNIMSSLKGFSQEQIRLVTKTIRHLRAGPNQNKL